MPFLNHQSDARSLINRRSRSLLIFGIALVAITFCSPGDSFGQNLANNLGNNFTNATTIQNLEGTITQLAFDPNDDNSLYVTTGYNGVWRFDYQQGGATSNGQQIVDPSADLNRNTNTANGGSYGLAFHDDPTLGSVLYLSRAFPNNTNQTTTAVGQGVNSLALGSIVRLTDTDGDGTWGNNNDVNQTVVDNILTTNWSHQISQFAVDGDTLYVGVGSRTNNGGATTGLGNSSASIGQGEAAHTGALNFIQDLTLLSNDTTTDNISGFNIDVPDGQDFSDADLEAYLSDTQAFTSTDQSKFRVFSTGLRNNFGITIGDQGDIFVSNNEGGEDPSSANPEDEVFITEFQADHGFAKENFEVGDYRDPNNADPSAQAAQTAGFFNPANASPEISEIGQGAGATGLAQISAPGNAFDDYLLVGRGAAQVDSQTQPAGGNDVVIVNPVTGNAQVFANDLGTVVTDVIVDPFGDVLISSAGGQSLNANGQITHVSVFSVPEPSSLVLLGFSVLGLAARRRRC